MVPWRMLVATRNRLIHGYLGIDDDTLWSIVRDKRSCAVVPELRCSGRRRITANGYAPYAGHRRRRRAHNAYGVIRRCPRPPMFRSRKARS
ncbi:HepT-like ribonuclease domain-containing protein [Pseudomonas delhiensis]|uniref:HepT-like ribonuclease domain-containing protein n=1 Tax=Pseudomonas delhiensis TaxID=366289 RepID=UPI0024467833|nr:HepT-like ribonuclease domain-containing protein [Pseudomonas delhiensis]